MDIKKLKYDQIKKVIEEKGFKFFEGKFNLNFVGIRNENSITNLWDDVFYALWQENEIKDGKTVVKNMIMKIGNFTTDPGYYYSQKKLLNDKGVAVLVPGQHRGMWKRGKHRGKYEAFVQNTKVTVYRDDNRDTTIDQDETQAGHFGINMHHGYDADEVGKMSAGCQVFRYKKDLQKVLDLFAKAQGYNGHTVSYTLLEASDFAA